MIWQYILVAVLIIFGFVVFVGAPYVPSRKRYINRAFTKLYPISNKDVLVDIGSGDGIVLRLASKKGAKAIGYEINPILVIISKILSLYDKKVVTKFADFWPVSMPSDATVIYVFAVTRDIPRIISKIQSEANRLNKTISVISYGSKFDGVNSVKELDAYHLYQFRPLQQSKAQV